MIKNPEINWKIVVSHYFANIYCFIIGIRGNLNRGLSNFFFFNFAYPTIKHDKKRKVVAFETLINAEYNNTLNETIKIIIFAPENYENRSLPVLINAHSGGWVIHGSPGPVNDYSTHDFIVIDVFYRLAPEYKFPTAVEDVYNAIKWLSKRDHPVLKSADFDNVSIIGESAGGNIAACVVIMARDRNTTIKIKKQVLIYPSLATEMTLESHKQYFDGFILFQENGYWFLTQYANLDDLSNKYLNPTLNTNFEGLPKTLLVLAKYDYIYSEGIYYHEYLQKGGVQSEVYVYPSVHGFYSIQIDEEDKRAFEDVVKYLKSY